MSNNLKRDIEPGEVVILKKEIFLKQYQDDTRFLVKSGYGLSAVTMGTAVYGYFLSDGEEERYEGYDIDTKATEEYQAKICQLDGEKSAKYHQLLNSIQEVYKRKEKAFADLLTSRASLGVRGDEIPELTAEDRQELADLLKQLKEIDGE